MRDNLKNVVLVFQGAFCQSNRMELEGIYRFAREKGWRIQTVEYAAAAESRLNVAGSDVLSKVKSLISFWRPIGCIVECSGLAPRFDIKDFGRTPTVFLDRHPSTLPRSVPCVYSDADSIAVCAAKELLSLGISDYAFVPWVLDAVWSRERGEKFAELIRINGKRFHLFDATFGIGDELVHRRSLAKWIAGLPKPCGIFAANDCLGEQIETACQSVGVAIPDEVAVIGVDDETQICENASPTLSSVRIDNERAGYLSAKLLSNLLAGVKCESCTFGACGLNRRASTQCLLNGGFRVAKAIEFIRLHACEGIDVATVVAQMGCSRRLADMYFKKSLGRTVLGEIHEVRLSRVKDLLSRPVCDMSGLANFAGYSSNDDLRRVFKKRFGCTMRQYRKDASRSVLFSLPK